MANAIQYFSRTTWAAGGHHRTLSPIDVTTLSRLVNMLFFLFTIPLDDDTPVLEIYRRTMSCSRFSHDFLGHRHLHSTMDCTILDDFLTSQ